MFVLRRQSETRSLWALQKGPGHQLSSVAHPLGWGGSFGSPRSWESAGQLQCCQERLYQELECPAASGSLLWKLGRLRWPFPRPPEPGSRGAHPEGGGQHRHHRCALLLHAGWLRSHAPHLPLLDLHFPLFRRVGCARERLSASGRGPGEGELALSLSFPGTLLRSSVFGPTASLQRSRGVGRWDRGLPGLLGLAGAPPLPVGTAMPCTPPTQPEATAPRQARWAPERSVLTSPAFPGIGPSLWFFRVGT